MAAVAHLPVAASSGSFLITPNVGLMIWTLLLFGISMFILWKLAFPRISEALDRRLAEPAHPIGAEFVQALAKRLEARQVMLTRLGHCATAPRRDVGSGCWSSHA